MPAVARLTPTARPADRQPDISGFLQTYSALESAAWQLNFVTVQRTGELLADVVMIAVHGS